MVRMDSGGDKWKTRVHVWMWIQQGFMVPKGIWPGFLRHLGFGIRQILPVIAG